MSRNSAPSMRASSSVESAIPLRGYFLSVGGALLLLLFAADWVLPAPLPIRFDESHSVRPQIRILSEMKRPEMVVIDTNRAAPPPTPEEIALTTSQLPSSDVASAAQEPRPVSEQLDESESSLVTLHLPLSPARESLAQLEPVARDQNGPGKRRRVAKSEPQRKFAQARSWKWQSARHPHPDTNLGWCDSPGGHHGSCRYAFVPSQRTKLPFREAQD